MIPTDIVEEDFFDEDESLMGWAREKEIYEQHIEGTCPADCEFCLAEQEELTAKKPKRDLISKGERTLKWRG